MGESIVVDVNYSAEDFARSTKFVTLRGSFIRYLWLVPLGFLVLCLTYAAVLTKGSFSVPRPSGLVALVFALIVVSLLMLIFSRTKYSNLVKRQFQKQIDSSPALRETKTIIFDTEGIKGQQVLGTSETHWDGVVEAAETADDFYFFTAKKFAMFVPKNAFSDADQMEQLRTLAKQCLKDRAKNLK